MRALKPFSLILELLFFLMLDILIAIFGFCAILKVLESELVQVSK